jgi:pyruvate kinase
MTNKDFKDVDFAIAQHVEWIALSFVRRAEDISSLRSYLQAHDSDAKIIAKIEKPEALANIDAIIEAADGIMVARGDLGVEIYIEEVPFWQKKIVQKCNMAAKPVIVATQMLDSMIENRRPTRAETTDVANAVLDGSDAVMLSGETSVGKYPVEVVRTMQKIVTQAELDASVYYRYQTVDPGSDTFLSDSVCLTAVNLARQIQAKAIVGMTRSGYTAYRTSKFRPEANIYIFSDNRDLLTTLNLVWGVRAFYYDSMEGTNESIKDTVQFLKDKGYIQAGDCVINTASMPLRDRGRTNMVKITVA